MVLGTDNQEKEAPCEGSPAMAPKLPAAPSSYLNVPPYLGAPPPQKLTQVCPLVETGGEFRPTCIHKPFFLLELIQIRQDLGSYTDDPGKYIDTFQHITLVSDLTGKDIMVIFSQTVSDPEYAKVLKEAQRYATGLHMSVINTQWGKLRSPPQILIGIIMTLSTSGKGIIFLVCVKAGVKSAQQKVISYAWVSATTQEPNENPIVFLKRLKETLQKCTNLDLDCYKGHAILKDKFLPQCASDIRIKLQQLQQQDPTASLDEMVQTATNTFYKRGQEEEAKAQEREKRKETRHAHILAALQGSPTADPKPQRTKHEANA